MNEGRAERIDGIHTMFLQFFLPNQHNVVNAGHDPSWIAKCKDPGSGGGSGLWDLDPCQKRRERDREPLKKKTRLLNA